MRVCISGVSVWGPGLSGWAQTARVLRGEEPWVREPVVLPPPACLNPNERRRSSAVTRLALNVAQEACTQSGLDPAAMRSVFASSNGDGAVVDDILRALTTEGGEVSPTRFHNSVHNAAAGYWTIGNASVMPALALGCCDWSFGQGLLKAAAECVVEKSPVLFVAYDMPIPGPIGQVRVTADTFGCGFVLAPEAGPSDLCALELAYASEPEAGVSASAMGIDNPAAAALPLLEAIAHAQFGAALNLPCLPGHLAVTAHPSAPRKP